jgi:uncharacterized protein
MLAMAEEIRVNFNKPLPLFPLSDTVLLPHAILPLHIFEPRYCQMIDDCLDQAGQVAMATYEGGPCGNGSFDDDELDRPVEIRPFVCVGQIVQHEGLPDGRHNILLHGVCRARIIEISEPDDERMYLLAELEPLEVPSSKPAQMTEVRDSLRQLLQGDRLSRMRSVDTVLEWFGREEIPTHALLELIGFTMVKDNEVKYQLLAEPDPYQRAELIMRDLKHIDGLIRRAEKQSYKSWPKGMSWN